MKVGADGKISKERAGYVNKASGTRKCGNCNMLRRTSCTLVRGVISPQAWCRYWASK